MTDKSSAFRLACSFVWLVGALVAQAEPGQVRFVDERYPGCEDPDWYVALLVDDITGEPIAGAEVFLVAESQTPIAGEFWFTRKGRSDADGVVRIPIADLEGKWHFAVLRHPGHGVCTNSNANPVVWRVGRPFDVPVLVLDWRGRPAPGAKIGFCGSCGHGPDLVTATAGEDGIAVLRGIDPRNDIADLYVQHPGLGLGYESISWYPGDPPMVLRCARAPERRGRVVDHLGRPAAGVYVSAPDVHRGPWARTDANGDFVLLGAENDVALVRTDDGREVWFPEPSRYPVTLRLPDPDGDDPHSGTIDVPVRDPAADETPKGPEPSGPSEVASAKGEAPPALAARLRVVDGDGNPLPHALVEFVRPGMQTAGSPRAVELDGDGAWVGPGLCAGDAVVVRLDEEAVPFRTVLRGDGPWTLRVPDGRVELRFRSDRFGAAKRATVLVGDVVFEARLSRPLLLRGLPPGPLRLVAVVPGLPAAIVETEVGDGLRRVAVTWP